MTEPISSSISDVQTQVESPMTTNVTPNSKGDTIKSPDFAAVLLTSLAHAAPSKAMRGAPEVSSDLNSENHANQSGNGDGRSLGRIQNLQTAGSGMSLTPKKSVKPENVPAENGSVVLTFVGFPANSTLNAIQPIFVNNAPLLNAHSDTDDIQTPEPNAQTPLSEIEMLAGSTKVDPETVHPLSTVIAPASVSKAVSSSPEIAVGANNFPAGPQSPRTDSTTDEMSAHASNRSAAPVSAQASASDLTDLPVPKADTISGTKIPATLTDPQGQAENVPLQIRSVTSRTPAQPPSDSPAKPAGTTQTQSTALPTELPTIFSVTPATSNVASFGGSATPTATLSVGDPAGKMIGVFQPATASAATGNIPAQPIPSHPLGQVANVSSHLASYGQNNSHYSFVGSADAPSRQSVASTALPSVTSTPSSEAATNGASSVARSTPPQTVSNGGPTGNSTGMPTESLNEVSSTNSFSIEADLTSLAPPIPEISLVASEPVSRQSIHVPDPTPFLSPITISVGSGATAQATPSSSEKNIEPSDNTVAVSFPAVLDSAATGDVNMKADRASFGAPENSRKESGKNSGNHPSNPVADPKSGNSPISPSEPVNAAALKVEPIAAGTAAQAIGVAATSVQVAKAVTEDGKASAHEADPVLRGGSPNKAEDSTGNDQQQPSPIQLTQLSSQLGKADVKIALQGEQFGPVELHAKVTGDQVSASITVEHHETHALLSGDLPALHQLLNDRQLRVSEILLLHDSLSSGSSPDGGLPAKREETSPQQNSSSSRNGGEGSSLPDNTPKGRTGALPIFDSRGRLSVRA